VTYRFHFRSKLFVPGSRPEFLPKAMAGPADALALDLEDAVTETSKEAARQTVRSFLATATGSKVILVRVNPVKSPHFAADVDAVTHPGLDILHVPKIESPEEVRHVADWLTRYESERDITNPIALLPIVETPAGVRHALAIAQASPRVMGLQAGFGDLFEPFGIDRADTQAVQQIRLSVRLATAEAGVPAWDGAFVAVADPNGFIKDAEGARRLGYSGKTCIHPTQVALSNQVFSPKPEEIARARRVVDAARVARSAGQAASLVDGHMIDGPFITHAEAILAMAQQFQQEHD
jgi:citrate lyase beta subunit